jgi:hypothetical protein
MGSDPECDMCVEGREKSLPERRMAEASVGESWQRVVTSGGSRSRRAARPLSAEVDGEANQAV